MYKVKTMNAIARQGLDVLREACLEVSPEIAAPDGLLIRSAALHDMEFNPELLCIGRAGIGVDNIPIDRCTEAGIAVFNTPGANAESVKELLTCALMMASRDIIGAIEWVNSLAGQGDAIPSLVEKGKKQFIGPELHGKKLGVIGLGAIGVKVANDALHLGMEVYGYDPYISVDAAWNLSRSVIHCVNLSEVLTKCDYITLHLPATAQTKGFMNASAFASMKEGVRLLNYARGELVDQPALIEALDSGKVAGYFTDFPTEELIGRSDVMCTPHLGASTPESEDNCAVMAADEIRDYLLNGNIRNSVNMPNVSQERAGGRRICVLHRNEPGLISAITSVTTEAGLNIENMVNKGKKDMAYTMLDATGSFKPELAEKLAALPKVVRVRIL